RRHDAPCPCDQGTLPETAALASIVAQLASQRSPIVTDWPAQWLVDIDAMEANGWRDMWIASRAIPAWQCTWWRCFRDWATAGAVPDANTLAPLLAARLD